MIKELLIFAAVTTGYAADCSKTSGGLAPLSDPFYFSRDFAGEGGLYPNRSNLRPPAHELAGLAEVGKVRPRSASGQIDEATGRIVFLSIGMSNTTQEFTAFSKLAQNDPERDPRVTIVDGAQGGWTAFRILNDPAPFWNTVSQRLTASGVTAAQVQIAWMKVADAQPTQPYPGYPQLLAQEMKAIAQDVRIRFPNLRLLYLSSRIYAGYASTTLNPEPYAWQSGLAVKWLVEEQINGDPALDFAAGKAPWLAWGPYLWADGLIPREDGLTWACAELEQDGTHPGPDAERKVGQMLVDFLHSDTTASRWYRKPAAIVPPQPIIGALVNAASGSKTFAAGSIGSIYGAELAASASSASHIPLPTSLVGTTVTVGGLPALLYYASPGQINFVMPWAAPSGEVIVIREGVASAAAKLTPGLYAPGIFVSEGNTAAALHANYSLINAQSPARPGEIIQLFFTGLGVRNPLLLRPDFLPIVRIAGVPAEVTWFGAAPGYPGLDQVNLVIPMALPPGELTIAIQIASEMSNDARIWVGAVSGN